MTVNSIRRNAAAWFVVGLTSLMLLTVYQGVDITMSAWLHASQMTWAPWVIGATLAATVLLLTRAVFHLCESLAAALSIAERIADGYPVDGSEFRCEPDVGQLRRTLGRMYANMQAYRLDAAEQHRDLEQKNRELAQSQSSLAQAQQLARMGNWSWDTGESQAHWSDETYRVLGFEPGECAPVWDNFMNVVDASERQKLEAGLRNLLKAPGTLTLEHYITRADGMYRCVQNHISSRADASGHVVHLHGTIQDITERKAVEEKMHYLAMYDTLTGLPNRQLFHEQLEQSIHRAQRAGHLMAVMFIDLDRFKRVNDTMGHATGDLLLKEVAARLGGCVRAADYVGREGGRGELFEGRVARLAGDEFTVTLDALKHAQDAGRVAQRIVAEMSRPFVLNGEALVVTSSVGIAIYPHDGEHAEILLKHADVAMYQAKQQGKNNHQFFAGEMNTAAVEKLKLEAALRLALERNEFELHYQPKVDVLSGRIRGVEALMRWRHPEWGMVMPGKFIPVAEEIGLIVRMGEWVLSEACRQLKLWREAGHHDLEMAINLASPSFREPALVSRVAAALREFDVPAAQLCLEATESSLMRDADATLATLRELRELGVKLSIDDFGTGYSSLSYLRRFPIDQLKIDRSFVDELTECADDAAIVAAIVSLARTLKLDIVAEGVETIEQAQTLADQGCRTMQGYLFSKPLPSDQLSALLADGSKLRALALRAAGTGRKPALVA